MKQSDGEQKETHAVSTAFQDGTLVELVQVDGATKFAVGREDGALVHDSVEGEDGVRLVPVPESNNLIKHRAVLLPGSPEPYSSTEELIASIEEYIARYVDLSPEFLRITSAYVLLSWVYDAFNELPYLRFRGEYGSGKTRALIVIGSLMYKPLFASGASTISPIFHSLDLFRGTLVIDESDFRMSDEKAELVKILNQGNVRGFPVLRSQATPQKTFDPRAFHVYGPKIVAMRHSFSDQALESRFLTEEMGQRQLRKDIPINLPDAQEEEAQVLRCKLLQYRFDTYHTTRVRTDAYDPLLSPRTNQIMIPLLSVLDDPVLSESIRASMRGTETMLAVERAASAEGQLLEVIESLKGTTTEAITVGEIADAFQTRFGAEYDRPITARYVGYLLRNRLHIPVVKRKGVFVLTPRNTGSCGAR
jgi:hypothetical protein